MHVVRLITLNTLTVWIGLPVQAACTTDHRPAAEAANRVAVDPQAPMVSHTEVFEVAVPAAAFNQRMAQSALEAWMPGTAKLPAVVGTRPLTAQPFGAPGAPRLVCLSDGSTASEEVLESVPGQRFRYLVWNYSTDAARAIQYGIGQFELTPLDEQRTRVAWTYAFKLKEDRFPGNFGAVGRWLMQRTFMDRDYAEMMRVTSRSLVNHFDTHNAVSAR